MPDGELFEFPVSLSPRLAWIQLHGVEVFCSENPVPGARWFCRKGTVIGAGDTDNDAIYDFCEKTGIKHWNIEA